MSLEALFRLFSGLPRQGPGSEASTEDAIRRLPALPGAPRVLDLGCGTGSQTLVLARSLGARVTAVDIHAPFLDELAAAARRFGLGDLVDTRCRSMDSLEYPDGSFDLIWSEGALYILGLPQALALCRGMLAPRGCLAFTEVTWLTETPAAEAKRFWDDAYPAIDHITGNRRKVEEAGFRLLDTFALPTEVWWREFYNPLKQRMERLREESKNWPELAAAIAESEREIELFSRHHASYGYVFYICQRVG